MAHREEVSEAVVLASLEEEGEVREGAELGEGLVEEGEAEEVENQCLTAPE